MQHFITITALLFFSFSSFGQGNSLNPNTYNIADTEIFDFSSCNNKKEVKKLYFKSLTSFIYKNLDKETLNFFDANLSKKDSSYALQFTYYRNNDGEIINDLIGSNLKRTNYESHKKLAALLSKSKLNKQKYSSSLKNRQNFVSMKFKKDTLTNELYLVPYKEKPEFKFSSSDSITVPVYDGCQLLEDPYSKKTYRTVKRCMEFKITNLVSENFNKEMSKKTSAILAKKYGIYDKKIRTKAVFKFNEEGKVTDIETLGLVPEIEDEVTRILKQIPEAQPGTKKGKPVPVAYGIPVTITTNKR